MYQEFEQPSAAYRSKPFWAWNAKLDEDELRRQIRIFKQMGLGGFFMHSRVGLNTSYLSEEWFKLVKGCIDEAEQTGTEAWLYDEDRWPSGSAGGLVTKNPEYRSKVLLVKRSKGGAFVWPEGLAYVFAVRFGEGNTMVSYRQLSGADEVAGLSGDEDVVSYELANPPESPWFNDTTYLDTMSEEAVGEFIRVTHEAYRREVGEHFGKLVPGIFTDEPTHTGVFRSIWGMGKSLPWTGRFSEKFAGWFGYDIIGKLPEVTYNAADGSYSQSRYHYHVCKTKLFADTFSGMIGQWCDDNDMLFTGHVLEECPVSANISMVGGPMQFYSHMQAPGIDLLTQYKMEYLTVKQCASVAHQMGRKWTLSELYGCTGWETTFETYKHSGDWQAVLGINLRCPHLSWYSMAGEAKRDYPASIHFQSPWYREYAVVEDYFSRVNVALTTGKPICDLAVLHPCESYYLLCHYDWTGDGDHSGIIDKQITDYDETVTSLINYLLGNHLDFDFADEALMADWQASVGSDELGVYLQIGEMRYRALLVPPLITLRGSTLDILKAFSAEGGKVVFAGSVPTHVDGVANDEASVFAGDKQVAFEEGAIVEALNDTARCLRITQADGSEARDVFYQLRYDNGNWILIMNNNNREHGLSSVHVELQTAMPDGAVLQRWDLDSGKAYQYPGMMNADSASFDVDFAVSGSMLMVIGGAEAELPMYPLYEEVGEAVTLGGAKWDYALDDHNVLVLDRVDVRAVSEGKKDFSRKQYEIFRIDNELRDHLGIRARGGGMTQPWVEKEQPLGATAALTLDYTFTVRSLPTGPMLLALEQAGNWTITLNDKPIDTAMVQGWWVDKAIETIPVDPTLLRKGRNTLRLSGAFNRHVDLELVYLLGQFGVKLEGKKGSLSKLPAKLTLGDWTKQGLPFYSGAVTYRTSFTHDGDGGAMMLKLPGAAASVMSVSVNGGDYEVVAFPDYSLEIGDKLKSGKNTLDVKVISSRRNAFGPFHLNLDHPMWTGPFQFRYDAETWQDAMRILPYGLLEGPQLQAMRLRG